MNAEAHRLHRLILQRLAKVVEAPDQIAAVLARGVERSFNQLVIEACRGEGAKPEDYLRELGADEAARAELAAALDAISHHPLAAQANRAALVKELEWQLHFHRYTLAKAEPPGWFWRDLGEEERAKVRRAAVERREEDPSFLPRVERAIQKLDRGGEQFGLCEQCSAAIRHDRLQLMPWAERCTSCQRKADALAPPTLTSSIAVVRFP